MKKSTIFLLITLFFCLSILSQDNVKTEVSFLTVEEPPIYPGCEGGKVELKKCFSKSVKKLFVKNIDSEQLDVDKGRYKIFVVFKINGYGNIVDIKVRSLNRLLTKESISVLNRIPKMIPGELEGEKVTVIYATSFTLVVD